MPSDCGMPTRTRDEDAGCDGVVRSLGLRSRWRAPKKARVTGISGKTQGVSRASRPKPTASSRKGPSASSPRFCTAPGDFFGGEEPPEKVPAEAVPENTPLRGASLGSASMVPLHCGVFGADGTCFQGARRFERSGEGRKADLVVADLVAQRTVEGPGFGREILG